MKTVQHKNKKYNSTPLLDAAGLSRDTLLNIARQTGLLQRVSDIDLPVMVECICEISLNGCVSFNDLAAAYQSRTGTSVSRQAFWERINVSTCLEFFQQILNALIIQKLDIPDNYLLKQDCPFGRLMVQDSTVIKLPTRLFGVFSGGRNTYTRVANARIQNVYDLRSMRFKSFSIDPYSKNDVMAASDILVQKGDLVLRDRGYLRIEQFREFKQKGVDAISRYKNPIALYDPDTGKQLDLLDLLSHVGTLDRIVHAGKNKEVRLRLMAAPVPEEIAHQRRIKIKKEHRTTPSQELLKLASWNIYLTTIENPAITIDIVLQIYQLRWRIENIFKTWKSNFNFEKIHNVSENQLRIILIARLIMITLTYHDAFIPLFDKVYQCKERKLSLMKFIRYVQQNLNRLQEMLNPLRWSSNLIHAIARYCTYDKRKRKNFIEKQNIVFEKLRIIDRLA